MHDFQFKQEHSLQERQTKSTRVLAKYSDRVPVICERDPNSVIPDMEGFRNKILVPKELTIAQFIKVIRKRIKITEKQSIFLFINDTAPMSGNLMSEVYQRHKDEDGFLYVSYSAENTFG